MIDKRIIRAQNDSDGTCDGTLKLISFNGKLIVIELPKGKTKQRASSPWVGSMGPYMIYLKFLTTQIRPLLFVFQSLSTA